MLRTKDRMKERKKTGWKDMLRKKEKVEREKLLRQTERRKDK